MKKILPILLCAVLLFTGCNNEASKNNGNISTATSSMSMKLDGALEKDKTVSVTVSSKDFNTVFSGVCGFQFYVQFSDMEFVSSNVFELPEGWNSTVTSPKNTESTVKCLFDCDFTHNFGNQNIAAFEFKVTGDNPSVKLDNIMVVYPDADNPNGYNALDLPEVTAFSAE